MDNLSLLDIISILSLLVGIISIVLAIYSMASSKRAEERSKQNFIDTQDKIRDFYDKTKEVLNEIDKRSSTTETVVSNSQEKLLNTMTQIINETVIPKKEDMGEQLGMMFFQQLLSNPKNSSEMINALQPFIDMAEKMENKKDKNENSL